MIINRYPTFDMKNTINRKKCLDCEQSLPLDAFGTRADGTPRTKCTACLLGHNRQRKIQPAPSENQPLPNIVRKALELENQDNQSE